MNNFIEFFYNIKVDKITYKDNSYSFIYNGYLYKLYSIDISIEQIKIIFNLNKILVFNSLMSEILINKYNNIVSSYDNNDYILIKLFINIKKRISLEEISIFSKILYKKNITSDWGKLWSNKIDYLEELINENGKRYPIIVDSFNYFVGMCENAISYFNSIDIDSDYTYVICHKKIKLEDTIEVLYNPLNIVFDFKVRDVAEYLKISFFNNNINVFNELLSYLGHNFLSLMEVKLLISRLLYPSFYFEMYEDILINGKDEKLLINVISRVNEYEEYLRNMISLFNKYYSIEEISWLKNK